jgi:SAM-dependent methyltransferase
MRMRDWLYWETRYLRAPHWDAPPPAVFTAALDEEVARHCRGRALDVGCGSGRIALYLAQRELRVTALDVSMLALTRARLRALRAGVSVRFYRGDLFESELQGIAGQVDLLVDVGFFHGLGPSARQRYATRLTQLLGSESSVVMMGLRPGSDHRVAGIGDDDLKQWMPELSTHSSVELSTRGAGASVVCVLRRA